MNTPRLQMLVPALLLALPLSAGAAANGATPKKVLRAPAQAHSRVKQQAGKKKTVSELLQQARSESRGGKVQLQKAQTDLPQSQLGFSAPKGESGPVQPNLDAVKPPKSGDIMREDLGDKAEYVKVLDQQINELYKLTQKFKTSSNRGEMWLRLAELYVEKATIIDSIKQDDYDRKLRAFQSGQTKQKPVLDTESAREYNRKAIQLYEWFERDFPKDEKISQAYFFLGFNHFEIGNVKKGVEYYTRLTKQFPNSSFVQEAHFALGEYYFENEKWPEAYKSYSPLLKDRKHRLHTFALYKSAWCLYRMGKNREALNYLEILIKTAQQDPAKGARKANRSRLESEALRDIVPFYASVGGARNASQYFKNLVGGDVTPYIEKLAYYYSDKGDKESSDEAFKQLIAQAPTHPKAFEYQYQIVQNYYYAKNSPKFKDELYRWITEYGPNSAWMQANKSNGALAANAQKLRETTLRNYILQQHQTAQNSRAPYSQQLAYDGYQLYLKEFSTTENIGDMRFYFGELLYDMNRFDEAAIQYQWVVEYAPSSKFFNKAAANLILSVEKGVPDDKELSKRIGSSLEPIPFDAKIERFIKAGKWYTEKFPTSEKTPEIKFRVGRLYYQSNHFDEASAVFRDIISKHSNTKYAEYSANLLLDIFNLRKDYAGLEKTGTELLAVPSIAGSKAGADIRGVLEKASFKKAQDLELDKKYAESAATFEAFAEQNPKSNLAITATYNAGVNYERAGQNVKAITAYATVMSSKDPGADKLKAKSRRLLAKLYQNAHQLDEAARLFRQAALEEPNDPLAVNLMYNAALLYEVLGRYDEAAKCYGEFMKHNKKWKENLEVVFNLAKLHDKSDQKAAAVARYKEYISNNPDDAAKVLEAHGRIAEILTQGNHADAEQWRLKTISLHKRLLASGKKPDPSWGAKAQMGQAQLVYGMLREIKFPKDPNKLKKTLDNKLEMLNKLVKETGDVVRYDSADQVIEALNLTGRAYEHMAESLRSAPKPAGLNADETKQYDEGVEKQFVAPNVTKAKEFHGKAVERGRELDAYNDAYRASLAALAKINGTTDTEGGEIGMDSRYIHWMAQ